MKRVFLLTAALLTLHSVHASAQYISHAAVGYTATEPADASAHRSRAAGAKTGALWGAAIGAGIGIFGIVTGDSCTDYGNGIGQQCEPLSATERALLFSMTTTLGALVGAGIGAIIGKEQPDSRAALELSPTHAGVRVAF